jgi:CelD/BcsL family acetyltransferase involved in cellulose biosynthesis
MTETCVVSHEDTIELNEEESSKESRPRIFEIDPLRDPRWKAFIDRRSDSSIFHQPSWLQALKSCYGYEPRVLSSTPPGEPLTNGIAFCQIRSPLTGRRLVSLPFSDHSDPLVGFPEELHELLQSLVERVKGAQWKYLEIRPIALAPDSASGFAISNRYFLHRLDLQPAEEKLFRSFHKDSVQRRIRRAEKEHLNYEEGSSEALLNQFYKLLIITRRRRGVPPQPLKWFRSLIACLGPNLKIRVTRKGDTPVAGILTISDRKKMVYKYGCSDPRFNNLGGTPLLFWRAIQDAKVAGMSEFDLGRSDTDNLGLVTFKEHWAAQRIELNYWRYPSSAAGLGPEHAIKHIRKLISIAPDKALAFLGRILYPHIG